MFYSSKFIYICLIVLFASTLTYASVDLHSLMQLTSKVEDELNAVIERSKMNPLDRLNKGPIAPHATTPEELARERPISVSNPAKISLPSLEPTNAILMESKSSIKFDPVLDGPGPSEAEFSAARKKFHASIPSDVEHKLGLINPRPIDLSPPRVQKADVLINANEVLPKDPAANNILMHFNQKYGVLDTLGLPNIPVIGNDIPDSELFDPKLSADDVTREYQQVIHGIDKYGFDAEKDSIRAIERNLASMWSKRWEYFAEEKGKADKRAKQLEEDTHQPASYPIDPLFLSHKPSPSKDALLGDTFVYNENPVNIALPSIEPRKNFVPRTSFYGPTVYGTTVDVSSIVAKKGPEFQAPEYSSPEVPSLQSIKLVPSNPKLTKTLGFRKPKYEDGLDIDRLVPATLSTERVFNFTRTRPTTIVASNNGRINFPSV